MTTRLSLFESPLFLGFDQLEKTIDRMNKSSGDGYPPYNIEQLGDTQFRISLAVAGFTIDDLDIVLEHNQLVIKGKIETGDNKEERLFLHRGIATRQFQRSFILSEDIEIEGAIL